MFKKIVIILTLLFFISPIHAIELQKDLSPSNRADYRKILDKLIPLVDEEDGDAQYKLAEMYKTGSGVNRNYDEAVKLYKRAAENGHMRSQVKLSDYYRKGYKNLISKNVIYGFMWLKIVEKLNSDSFPNIKILFPIYRNKISDDEKEEATQLARECIEKNFKNCTNEPEKSSFLSLKEKESANGLVNDQTFQNACQSSTKMKDWQNKKLCSCAGYYTRDFEKAVSAKDLAENPGWVKQPDASTYSDLAKMYKDKEPVEFGSAIKLKNGKWFCRASFFGFVTGNGSLDLDWRGRYVVKGEVDFKGIPKSLKTKTSRSSSLKLPATTNSSTNSVESLKSIAKKKNINRPNMLEKNISKLKSTKNCQQCYLKKANLEDANLIEANLSGANLEGANLEYSYLNKANLEDANLIEANLSRANLYKANLEDANLIEANLSGANLYEANLKGANLEGADLKGAYILEANFRGAYLHGAKLDPRGLKIIKASGAIFSPKKSVSNSKSNNSNNLTADRLTKLKKLLDAGLITKEEAAQKRKAILDSL